MGELTFAPLLPWPAIAGFAALVLVLSLVALFKGGPGALWRLMAGALITLALLDPKLVREDREPQSDVVVAVVDRTASQSVGERRTRTDAALEHLKAELARFPNTELRISELRDTLPVAGAGA